MPQTLALLPIIVSSAATTVLGANLLYLGTYAALAAGAIFGSAALQGAFAKKPSAPKPEDGQYNLKQSVPSLSFVLGRTKKASDYVFLEEKNGTAYHILVWAGHQISGYYQHYLHDELIARDANGYVTGPAHFFDNGHAYVRLISRLGFPAESAYDDIAATFPTIWTLNHRGDGLASVRLSCDTAPSEDYLKIFPNQMPSHSAIGDGALLYDPRTGVTSFSTNLALMRLWHLTHPVGGKLNLADMYMPDWREAAATCDDGVVNRDGVPEYRYHGGFWFRAENDPTEVGRIMDQAGELVVFERPDGLVGVHSGKYVEPDIRLTAADIIRCSMDVNKRRGTSVLAVRGRWTSPAERYNTVDAAIYGDPYIGEDTERTKTVDNQAVQTHNHIQRMQKLAYIRANAPRVTLTAHYSAAKQVPYRRFVRVHLPPRMNEVVVEITSTPKLSLRNMTIEFSGILVPSDLYAFNSATEEGVPGSPVVVLPPAGVPIPQNFDVVIQTETLAGGQTAAFALGSWDHVSNALVYELEWETTSGSEPPRSANSKPGNDEVRSSYLSDGAQYRFRLRAWSNGASSDWTAYEIRTATADASPPGVVTGVSATGGVGQITFNWAAPNSVNYFGARIYTNTVNSFAGATLRRTEYGPPATADSYIVTGLSAGTYYGFVEAINASGVPASPVATGSKVVT